MNGLRGSNFLGSMDVCWLVLWLNFYDNLTTFWWFWVDCLKINATVNINMKIVPPIRVKIFIMCFWVSIKQTIKKFVNKNMNNFYVINLKHFFANTFSPWTKCLTVLPPPQNIYKGVDLCMKENGKFCPRSSKTELASSYLYLHILWHFSIILSK